MTRVLALLLAMGLAGCLFPPLEVASVDVFEGRVSLEDVRVEPLAAPLGELAARVRAEVVASEARSPSLEVALDDEGCQRHGPPSAPSTPVASERLTFPEGTGRYSIDVELRGRASVGVNASAYLKVGAENALDPIFGECHEHLRSLPSPR